jgi:S-adenosylmethionine synthetase
MRQSHVPAITKRIYMSYFFTSEAVTEGHPDKIADQISDAVLDAHLSKDPHSRVACETVITTGLVFLTGEITSNAHVDYQNVVRETIKKIGYNDSSLGFDYRSCAVLIAINKQSEDIAQGVNEGEGLYTSQGAGDQGMVFGYATDETEELMPLPLVLSHKLASELKRLRHEDPLSFLRPDGKTQVTVEYDECNQPQRVDTVLVSTQHTEEVSTDELRDYIQKMIYSVIPGKLMDEKTRILINPTGRFVVGGPKGDSGLTGRKIIVDTYGGFSKHGGGAFSGKDPSKIDRSAAYFARYIAKNIVKAKIASRCEIQISYAIGFPEPISVKVESFGTSIVSEEELSQCVVDVFDMTPKGIVESLDLLRPIYSKTASGGHFGRNEPEFTWEHCDRCQDLIDCLKLSSVNSSSS